MLATAAPAAAPALPPAGEPPLSAALQSYLRNCVRERLQSEGRSTLPWFRIHLYLRLGDASSAAALDRDLRQQGPTQGLIALFGELGPGLTIQTAMARQLHLMHGADTQLQLVTPPSEQRLTQLTLDSHRYSVLTLHGEADCLHHVMPCPMLVFCPAD